MSVEPESESTGNAELDKRLSRPILRGDVGIDTAQVWISAFLIFIVGLIGWSSSIRIPFQGLDQQVVRDNTALHSLVTLPNAVVDGAPQPLALFTLALNWAAAPGSPGLMRFTSLLLHLANGLLVFLVCRRLMPKSAPVVAMIAGMLFVLHPLASESVLYAIGRGPVLATTLSLASILLFIRAVTDETGVKSGALVASVFCFIFAALADASAVVVPAILIAVHWALNDRAHAPWRVHVPYWAALLALAVYIAVDRGLPAPGNVPALFAQYARLSFIPYGLSIVHDAPAIRFLIGMGVIALAVLLTAAMTARRSVGGLAALWLVLGLAYAAWHGPAVVECRAYFALAGLALLAPWLYEFVQPGLRPIAGIAAAALVLAVGATSYWRTTTDWTAEWNLWWDAARKAPLSPIPATNVARLFTASVQADPSHDMQIEKAQTMVERAINKAPTLAEPRLWMAVVLRAQGKTDEALQSLFDALRIDLNNRDAALGAANLLFDIYSNGPAAPAGQSAHSRGSTRTLAEAIDLYRKADAVSPLDAYALARLAAGLSQLGHLEAAESALKRAAALQPADQALAQSLKNIDDARKRSAAVEQQAVTLLKKNPRDPNGLKLVAQAHALRGNPLAASYSLDAVWQTGAADFPTWVLTGFVWARLGAVDNFVRDHPVPPAKPAETPFAWAELAKTCAASGMWDAAETYLRSQPARDEQPTTPLLILADIAQQLNQPQRTQQFKEKAASQ